MARVGSRLAFAAVVAAASAVAGAQSLDAFQVLVPSSALLASGGTNTWAFTYDPATDTAWAGIQVGSGQTIRRVTGVSTASPVTTTVLSTTALDTWARLDQARTGTLFPFGLAMNPAAVGSVGTRGNLWVVDIGSVTAVSSSTTDPAASPIVWRYNLQPVPTSDPNPYNNLNQVLTRVASRASQQIAATGSSSTLSVGSGRQPAFSNDGRWLYMLDNGAANRFPGIYRIDPVATGSVVRLATPVTTSTASEPAAVKVGSNYRVYYRSATYPDALTYVEDNPTAGTTSAETVALSAAQLNAFMESGTSPVISSITSDTAGNVYFYDGNPSGLGNLRLLRLDTAGRLVKVAAHAERSTAIPGTVLGMNRLQAVPYTHPTAGQITRLFFIDLVSIGASSILSFRPTDFNRDGLENAADAPLFLAKLGTRGSSSAVIDGRFDLNGNGSIDWRDVKTFQTFRTDIRDGDADMNGLVNFADLNVLRDNYLGSGKTWAAGDFASVDAAYPSSAPDANQTNYTDLAVLAGTWLNVLSQPKPTLAQLDQNNYTGQFREDVIAAFGITATPSVTWASATSGAWGTTANWSGFVPDATDAAAVFSSAAGGDVTVTLGAPRTLGSLTFDNAVRKYTLSGTVTQPLTLDVSSGSATVTVSAGTHTVAVPVVLADPAAVTVNPGATLTVSGAVSGGANLLAVSGGGTFVLAGGLTTGGTLSASGSGTVVRLDGVPTPIAASGYSRVAEVGSVSVSGSASVSVATVSRASTKAPVLVASAVSLSSGGSLDLGNGDLVVRNGASAEAAIRALVAAGDLLASASQPSSPVYQPFTTLAVFPNIDANGAAYFSSYDGVSLTGADLIVKYTYIGDTNLDGTLTGHDLVNAIEGFSLGLTGWANGDVDHSGGAITAADVGAVAAALQWYSGQSAPITLGTGQAGGGGSGVVPEPAALSALALLTSFMARRRRARA